MSLLSNEEKARYRQCRDCIFFDVYADGQVTEYLCQRQPLADDEKYRNLSADLSAYRSCSVPCAYKVPLDRVLEIIKERFDIL